MSEPRPSVEMQALHALWELLGRTYIEAGRMPSFQAVEAACMTLRTILERGELPRDSAEDERFVTRLALAIDGIDGE